MKVVIKNLSQQALLTLEQELDPMGHWLDHYEVVDTEFSLYDVTLSDCAQIKTHINTITVDCGGHLSSIEEDDFESVVIV